MNTFKSFILGLALIAIAIVIIRTGDIAMGIYTIMAALSAAAFIGHALRLVYDSADNTRRPIKAAA